MNRGIATTAIVLTWTLVVALPLRVSSEQRASGGSPDGTLPKDVYPDSRNRLPVIGRDDLDERGKRAYDEVVKGAASPRSPQGSSPDTPPRVGAERPVGHPHSGVSSRNLQS